MARMFGTDGVRGIAGKKLNAQLAYKLGLACAHVLTGEVHKAKILIGRDTRISGDMLENALVAGICSAGAEAQCLGIVPTPAIAHFTRAYGADAGVVISASHNSFEYNGIKFFNGHGYKLADAIEDEIEELVNNIESLPLCTGKEIGRRIDIKNATKEYVEFLCSTINERLDGLKVVLDCANGASFETAEAVMKKLGAEVYTYYNDPNGININDHCGSTDPATLRKLVMERDADVGLAFDGDADRLIAVDEYGKIVDGDRIMAICAVDLKNRGLLKNDTLVTTIMSNIGLEIGLKEQGINIVKTGVGDRYVLEEMLKSGYSLGGEQSGHIIFLDHNSTGDGVLSAIQLLSVMKRSGKKLSELANVIEIYPQVLIGAKVADEKKNDWKNIPEITALVAEVEEKLEGNGRVLIRASGTEALVRVMIEGKDKRVIEEDAVRIAKLIESHLKEEA
ncbi:MAG: phosphoglucosamine mutase [Clostridiales bacterium]|nr:phosphoglucosamine mutase [Clostridiales bacterium]